MKKRRTIGFINSPAPYWRWPLFARTCRYILSMSAVIPYLAKLYQVLSKSGCNFSPTIYASLRCSIHFLTWSVWLVPNSAPLSMLSLLSNPGVSPGGLNCLLRHVRIVANTVASWKTLHEDLFAQLCVDCTLSHLFPKISPSVFPYLRWRNRNKVLSISGCNLSPTIYASLRCFVHLLETSSNFQIFGAGEFSNGCASGYCANIWACYSGLTLLIGCAIPFFFVLFIMYLSI